MISLSLSQNGWASGVILISMHQRFFYSLVLLKVGTMCRRVVMLKLGIPRFLFPSFKGGEKLFSKIAKWVKFFAEEL